MRNTLNDFTIPGLGIELGVEGFSYADLYRVEKLKQLAERFYDQLGHDDAELHAALQNYIVAQGHGIDPKAESALLIAAARHLSVFIARLFGVASERDRMIAETQHQDVVFEFKHFVTRRALKSFTPEQVTSIDVPTGTVKRLREIVLGEEQGKEGREKDEELEVASVVSRLLAWEKQIDASAKKNEILPPSISREIDLAEKRAHASGNFDWIDSHARESDSFTSDHARFVKLALRVVEMWAAVHALLPEARFKVRGWVSFKSPHQLDYQHLVKIERSSETIPEEMRGPDAALRRRDGFRLTDVRATKREVLDEVNYCIYCHEREKDSCSKGFHERDGQVKRNPLGTELTGCPLDEKISEMHLLKKEGDSIAALALIVIDNPLCPGTGHRICNDCMKSCIFQKQDPVNIPQAETGVLTDVLELPYGFEIYSLLTRWNPINRRRPYALPFNSKNVLVVGLGPAGYTLAHYLLNEGFGVIGIDGLKIEPLDAELIGTMGRVPRPIRDVKEIYQELETRILSGFGGVSEYGITVRWDKNFLTLINLTLARRKEFRSYGGIRFGGTMTIEDAWELGFDHIAIATGAGRPTIVPMKNNLIKGIRQASDFLMALQLTGAFKRDTLANLQVRLPAVVIGGGLTAIDTATETFAYYPVQVEKILARYEELVERIGEKEFWLLFSTEINTEERNILEEFIAHGRAVRSERLRARAAGEEPDFVSLVRSWGGVSIVYRKRLQDSPAYRLNHEEVVKSLEEGISFIEDMNPVEAVPDEFGGVKAVIFERMKFDSDAGYWTRSGELVEIPARSVQVAAGTSPNTTYEKEFPGVFALDEGHSFFAPHKIMRGEDRRFHVVPAARQERAFFTSYQKNGRFITYYGDNHPVYAGNVVKAMASAKDGYEQIVALFADEIALLDGAEQSKRNEKFAQFITRLDDQLIARVVRVDRLTPTIVDVVVRAPMQARKFHPGQFYRLQNFETTARQVDETRLMMEGLALTGAWVDKEKGLLSLIVLEMGASSKLCALLEEGEQVIVMGPTGAPTEIPEGENVLLVGGGLGNAVLFSIAKALRAKNNRVVYFAGYRKGIDLFKREEIEDSTDQVIWSTDNGDEIKPHRPQDRHLRGNIVEAMRAYAAGELGEQMLPFAGVDRIIAIGSDAMMAAVKTARHNQLAATLKRDHVAIGSINSPMQCMMKEICAQCLQRQIDPQTGEEKGFIFSCFNQDQILDTVDFNYLRSRLSINSAQEKLANLWLDSLLNPSESFLNTAF